MSAVIGGLGIRVAVLTRQAADTDVGRLVLVGEALGPSHGTRLGIGRIRDSPGHGPDAAFAQVNESRKSVPKSLWS